MQDTTPVKVGTSLQQFTPGPGYASNIMPVAKAQDVFNKIWGAGSVEGASMQARKEKNNLLALLRNYTNSELGTRGAVEDAWNDALVDASRAGVDVFELLAGKSGFSDDEKRKGRGGYTGPVSSVSYMDPQSAGMLLNTLATDMLGRNLTPKELDKYTQQFRQAESQNPTVQTSTKSSVTQQQGMTDEEIARSILQDNPVFADNVLKTDVLDMFFNRIGENRA